MSEESTMSDHEEAGILRGSGESTMSDPLFKIGDVVALRSGSTPMTVESVSLDIDGQPNMVKTVWFDKNDMILYAFCVEGVLVKTK